MFARFVFRYAPDAATIDIVSSSNTDKGTFKQRLLRTVRRAVRWADHRIPPGVRTVLGIILTVAGFFGFLPVLGFWMTPVGLCLIVLDIPPWRRRLLDWLDRVAPPEP